jgi:hypothetical protein
LFLGAQKKSRILFSCERELYKGTAPEQKTKNAKTAEDSMSSAVFLTVVVLK